MATGGITIRVTGLTEALAFFTRSSTEIHQTSIAALNEGADLFVSEATKNAHVITGKMKASINKTGVQGNTITVGATAPYSAFENRRGSPHDFATKALQTTASNLPDIMKRAYDDLLSP